MKKGRDAPGPSSSDPEAKAEQRRIRAWSQEASSRLEGVRRPSDLPPPPAPDPDDWPLATRLGCVLPVVLTGGGLVGWGVSHWGLALAGQATIYVGLVGLFLSFAWICGSVGIYAVTVAPFLDMRRSVKPLEALGGFLVLFATSLGVAGRIFLVGLALTLLGGVMKLLGG